MEDKYIFNGENSTLYFGDVLDVYNEWDTPTVIVSDGAYGVGSFDGDPSTVSGLSEWYEPHIKAWSELASAETTLWFWGTELGWATVHHDLIDAGWEYRGCNVWDKGKQHIAGNINTKTMRKFPQVTEVCVQYVWERLNLSDESKLIRDWFRDEWKRAGLTFQEANDACDVKDAASRKYFANDRQWYPPPDDKFKQLKEYANTHGEERGKPYFELPDEYKTSNMEGATPSAKFDLPVGITNVWTHPPLHNSERVQGEDGALHPNQKPKELMKNIITASSNQGDVIWEPFGGLCTASVASIEQRRKSFAAEMNETYAMVSIERMKLAEQHKNDPSQSKLDIFND